MKNIMKKCLLISLVICVVTLFNMAIVYAEGTDLTLAVDKTSVEAGDTVTVVVRANCESNLSAVSFKINYDKDIFDVESKTIANGWANYSSNADVENLKYDLLSNSSEMFTQIDALTVVFRVKPNVSGNYEITTEGTTITDISNHEFNIGNSSVSIEISSVSDNPGGSEEPAVPSEQEPVAAQEVGSNENIGIEEVKDEEDSTVAKNKLPKAGIGKGLIIVALVVIITSVIMYKKNQKYEGS